MQVLHRLGSEYHPFAEKAQPGGGVCKMFLVVFLFRTNCKCFMSL